MSNHLPAYAKYDLFFSPQRISALKGIRGKTWQRLVAQAAERSKTHSDALALSLTVIEICGCATCEKDSYRAQMGCATCARRTLQSFKGNDDELLDSVEESHTKIKLYLANTQHRNTV